MFKNEDEFKKLIDRLNIDDKSSDAHCENLRRQMLLTFNETHQKASHSLKSRLAIGRTIMKNPIGKLAAVAAIIIAVSFLVVLVNPTKQADTAKTAEAHISPAELTTFAALSFAYRQGGMEMVEQMCDKALKKAGPRPAEISAQDLLEKYNGKNPERTKL